MFGGSFRSVARVSLPRAGVWKLTSLLSIVALFATSCGSSARREVATRVVRGPAFRFSAPSAWSVHATATVVTVRSRAAPPAIVSAAVYRLARSYTSARFAAATKELDSVAARLAGKAGGSVTVGETTTVDGRKIRAYRFTARSAEGQRYEDRIGFVLSGKREVQLLCQAPAGIGDPDGACALLFDSFRLTP
jgi:hypothetical protein